MPLSCSSCNPDVPELRLATARGREQSPESGRVSVAEPVDGQLLIPVVGFVAFLPQTLPNGGDHLMFAQQLGIQKGIPVLDTWQH